MKLRSILAAEGLIARCVMAKFPGQGILPLPWEMTRAQFTSQVFPKGEPGWEVLYHGTYLKHLPSILRQGLLSSRGSGLWANQKPGGDRGEILIQFQIPPGTPTGNRSSAGGYGHVQVFQDVSPKDFLSVNGPWPMIEDVEDNYQTGPQIRSDKVRDRANAGALYDEYIQAAVDAGILDK